MIENLELISRLWPLFGFLGFLVAWHVRAEAAIANLREAHSALKQEVKDKSEAEAENTKLLTSIEIRLARMDERITTLLKRSH